MDENPLNGELELLNERLVAMGLNELAVVDPADCIPQRKNARYMRPELMRRLVENVKRSGTLESVPLVARVAGESGKFQIISGHHRIEAAKKAGLKAILVMVAPVQSGDELVSKQLAHNSLEGADDPVMLAELFGSIKDLELRLATGLQDQLDKMAYVSISFKAGEFRQFVMLFLPEDEGLYDEAMEKIAELVVLKHDDAVRVTSMAYYDRFAAAIRKVKGVENIKNNGVALLRLVELAEQQMMVEADGQQQ